MHRLGNKVAATLLAAAAMLTGWSTAEAAGSAQQPTICNRACWGARSAAYAPFGTTGTWNRACVHHTANTGDFNISTLDQGKYRVRVTQDYHMLTLGWSDIGYHFLVDKLANAYEGLNGSLAATNVRGAHDAINNASGGFNIMGWFDNGYNVNPTQVQLDRLYDVIAWRMPNGWSPYGSSAYGGYSDIGYLYGHYNVSTKTCPGTNVQPLIGTNFSTGTMRNQINNRINPTAPYKATYVSNSFPASVRAGQEVTVSVTYANAGSATWNASTKLGTSVPRDRASSFYLSTNWENATRPTALDQASVAPGANGSFSFIAKAPTTLGSYQEKFELVQEGVTWFGDTSDDVTWYVDVVAPPAYEGSYVSNTFPASVNAGQTVTLSVTFKNTGANTWDGNTRLGTSNPRDRNSVFYNSADWLGANRATAVDASTAPGANGTFTFVAKAPMTAGAYQEKFELLQEGTAWFPASADASVTWYVNVIANDPPAAPTAMVATSGDSGVGLDWANNSEGDLSGYNVYRSSTINGTYSKLNGSLLGASQYNDVSGTTNGSVLFYYAKAQDNVGQESAASAKVIARPHASNYIKLEAEGYDIGTAGTAFSDSDAGNSGGVYRSDDVDVGNSAAEGNFVGWIAPNEWLKYSGIYGNGGSYRLRARTASLAGGGSFYLEVNGVNVTGTKTVPSTGSFDTWTTVDGGLVTIPTGPATLRVVMPAGSWNLNWFDLTQNDKVVNDDAGAPGFTQTGTWTNTTTAGYQGYDRYSLVGGAHTATWNLAVPTTGNYKIEAIFRNGTNRATAARYNINRSGGTSTVNVDQKNTANLTWVNLGTFAFNAGTGSVVLDAAASTGGTVVMADCIRWTFVP